MVMLCADALAAHGCHDGGIPSRRNPGEFSDHRFVLLTKTISQLVSENYPRTNFDLSAMNY